MSRAILFKNNETGIIAVKAYIGTTLGCCMCGPRATPHDEVKKYQAYYNNVFGKDKYTFFIGDDSQRNDGY